VVLAVVTKPFAIPEIYHVGFWLLRYEEHFGSGRATQPLGVVRIRSVKAAF
jgi:hypothetical protein